ncbi:MAG: hypothetical protein WAV28_03345 [Sedimentisphaerales bacterium]|jgi:hypothetical protein
MSAESEYIGAESQNLLRTSTLIRNLLEKKTLTDYEVIALGKLLQDVYTSIKRILRSRLETRNIKIKKTESWHKQILLSAREQSLVSQEQFEAFRNLLLFRHLQIHGYGYMLEEERLRDLAEPAVKLCQDFLNNIA